MTRWTTAKDAASAPGVQVAAVWRWVRHGLCAAKRLPGERGRVLVGVDSDGFPVPVDRRRAARRR